MEIFKLLNSSAKKLKDKNIISHQLDAEILLSNVLKISREKMLIDSNNKISPKILPYFQKMLNRRLAQEPVAYILNKREFWSQNFSVNKDTLIPRPETELMVDRIVKMFKKKKLFILDIGTGSGCILLSLLYELKNSKGIGIDISKNALKVAYQNAKYLKLNNRAKFFVKCLSKIYNYKFDLIVSNPPYISKGDFKNLDEDIKKFEPKVALDGEMMGLTLSKKLSTNPKVS